eukprot:GHVR01084947.1.p1 GENE.GHVR01084947.1~~GHVR01084947.1.p1  ORF type:complete len:467 (+),score=45.60 GHVR01084947.1:127-1401(+)
MTPIDDGYNSFYLNVDNNDEKHTCVFSNYTHDIIIKNLNNTKNDLSLNQHGCVRISSGNNTNEHFECSNSRGKMMDVYRYDDFSSYIYETQNFKIKEIINSTYHINCIIGSSGVLIQRSKYRSTHRFMRMYRKRISRNSLFFFNKVFKYSKKNTEKGITVYIVEKKIIYDTIKSNNKIHELHTDKEWAFPLSKSTPHNIGFDMTYVRTVMYMDLLLEHIPNICLGLDDNGEVSPPKGFSTRVNESVILRSIALGIFPPNHLADGEYDDVENKFRNSDVMLNKQTNKDLNNYIELHKVTGSDIALFHEHCVPHLINDPDVEINITNVSSGTSITLIEGKLLDAKMLQRLVNQTEWKKENPWNFSIFQKDYFNTYWLLIGSKILEERRINDEGDFLYYYNHYDNYDNISSSESNREFNIFIKKIKN